MSKLRSGLVLMLIAGLVAGGCQTVPPEPRVVCEYGDGARRTQFTLQEQGVFALVRLGKPSVQATLPNLESRAEIKEIGLDGGSSIGFRRKNNQLIGFAGTTTMPLEEGHYGWVIMTEDAASRKAFEDRKRREMAVTIFGICTFGAGFVAILLVPEWLHADVSYGEQTMN